MGAERTLPIRWDLTGEDAITQGGDWIKYHAFTYLNTDTDTVEVWDTTDHTAEMVIRADYDDDEILLELTTENGRLEVGGTDWSLKMHIAAATAERGSETGAKLKAMGLGVYTCKITDPFGHVTPVLHGRVALEPETT